MARSPEEKPDVSTGHPNAELLAGDDCLEVRDGRLVMEEADLADLADRFGTPVYVISERQLRRNARAAIDAFGSRWPEGPVLVMPSIKANLSLALRRILTEEGTGCDTFGAGELEAALRTGVDPQRISVNGSTKDVGLLERAIAAGVRITLDSVAELDLVREAARATGATAAVRLRLRPWLEIEQPSELAADTVSVRLATQRYKPGIPTEQLLAIPRDAIEAPELDVRGVMAHIGRQGREVEIWAELARWVAGIVGELGGRWGGWRPREIDIGGGFPVPRDPLGGGSDAGRRRGLAPGLDEYAEAITASLRSGLERAGVDATGIQLEVEPGRSLYGNAGLHLTRVRHVKAQTEPVPLRWVETDTSEIFVADVVFERNRWNAVVANRAAEPPTQTADIVGISCNLDVIVADAELPEVEPGDLIAFLDTGAYQDANASNFNALPRPATVLVNGAEAELIKLAETTADVFARDRVPARLRAAAGDTAPARRLDHVSVSCGDLERSLGFYSELLGIPVRARGEAQGGEVAAITGVDAAVRWADLELGNGQVLELLQYATLEARPSTARFFDPGSGHISLRVPSAAAAHSALVEAGVEVRGEPVEITEPGHWLGARCFYATDPDGVTVEIIERP
jgi:diaminopimelate decarboxylase